MSNLDTGIRGVIHGKTIQLEDESGLPDGQEVRVIVLPTESEPPTSRIEYLRRSAGAWADDPKWVDEFLEWNRNQRDQDKRPEID